MISHGWGRYPVERAITSAEGRVPQGTAFRASTVELVVSDLQMPVLDGLALLAHVRSAANPIPVILVSGAWTPAQRERARELGAARFLSRPVDLAQLARDVEDLAG